MCNGALANTRILDAPTHGGGQPQPRGAHGALDALTRRGGARGSTLIVNLPGSPTRIEETAGVLEDAVPHALPPTAR